MKKLLSVLMVGLITTCTTFAIVTEKTNTVNLVLANVCDGSFNDFNLQLSGYDNQKFVFRYNTSLTGVNCVFRITKPIQGTIYLDVPATSITVSGTNVTWSIARTNIPPPGNYYGELLSYESTSTNIYRSLAQGKLPITWSLYLNETNYFQRITTNASVGQVYVHPNWIDPPWVIGTSGMAEAYVLLTTYNAYTATIVNTNAAFQALFNAQVNTNVGFQALHTAQATTNIAIAARMAAVEGYTNAAYTALTNGSAGTWTNLSQYNNDIAGLSTNLSLFNNDIGFLTNEPTFLASVAYNINAAGTTRWEKASTDATSATGNVATLQVATGTLNTAIGNLNTATGNLNTAVGNLQTATNSLQDQINNLGGIMFRYFADSSSNVFVLATGTNITATLATTTYTFTIPSGVQIMSAVIKWNGLSLGSSFKVVLAEDLMNTTAMTRHPAIFQAYRSDNGNIIAGASCRPDDLVNFNTENVYGLQAINYNICVFNW
jgi:hypothetical protein